MEARGRESGIRDGEGKIEILGKEFKKLKSWDEGREKKVKGKI